ncbi:MAG TPA: 16S rRNA (cytidine(1402)-2'-O)-methyltransferase [bacterium]|nr:16S rRNA (cytidine(1402)-2'-O)-methyltransferase [bacterium]
MVGPTQPQRSTHSKASEPGTLYVVATPIGNLDDITLRAIETLRSVHLIACEDTRRTRKLLSRLEISAGGAGALLSYFEGNELARTEKIIAQLRSGNDVALVSDAGTPAISDPGFPLLRAAIEHGIRVIPVPGPSAPTALLSAAGMPTDRFLFEGFLPRKKGKRAARISEWKELSATVVLFESPKRIARTLQELLELLGDRDAAIGRELTKLHEEIVRGPLSELAQRFSGGDVKGEIVLAIAGAGKRILLRSKSTSPKR